MLIGVISEAGELLFSGKFDILGQRLYILLSGGSRWKCSWARGDGSCDSFCGQYSCDWFMCPCFRFNGSSPDAKERQDMVSNPWRRVQVGLGVELLAEWLSLLSADV